MRTLIFLIALLGATNSLTAKTVEIGPDERPAQMKLPWSYDEAESYPLILLLHGFTATAWQEDLYLGTSFAKNFYKYLLLSPNGTKSPGNGKSFWNATPECCDFDKTGVDDAGYLRELVREAQAKFKVDPKRIYLLGHSNGGFMASRLACDDVEGVFAGMATIAGSTFSDPELCLREKPIKTLQIHGTEDEVVYYDTKGTEHTYPGAMETLDFWAQHNSCKILSETKKAENLVRIKWEFSVDEEFKPIVKGDFLDFVTFDYQKETDTLVYDGCAEGARSALWRVNGYGHAPFFYGSGLVGKILNYFEPK